jgi:hypothetical protein
MRLSRPCYDKYHNCPGWTGGGMYHAKRHRCDNGKIHTTRKKLWRWRFHSCDTCNVVVLPYVTRWLDPSWFMWRIRRKFER